MSRHSATDAAGTAKERALADEWQSTRAQTALATQFVNEDDYLATAKQEVGRITSADTHELFVSCDPGQALQQQFEHLQPDFIAVHDVGTASARKLLVGVAAASGRKIQKLIIRRQGYGTSLASMEFVELPTAQGTVLRMYATEADADTTARHALARTLLGFSRLGVIMVGDLPSHAIQTALKPIREAMVTGPWDNRLLLLLPLASASTLVADGSELGGGTGVEVRTTPQVTRPADAWNFINASWSQLSEAGSSEATAPATLLKLSRSGSSSRGAAGGGRLTNPLTMRPMPTVESRRATLPAADVLERYLRQLGQLTGMVSCCVFEVANGREVAHAGAGPSGTHLALHGTQLLTAMGIASRTLGLGHALPDAAITLGEHHLLLREVPRHPGLALHAVLDKTSANLTLVRLQLQRLDALFDEPAKPG